MSDPIDDYCAAIRRELPGTPGANDVLAELEDHLREAAELRIQDGAAPEDAAQQAVDRFGSVPLVGRRLRAEHGPTLPDDPAPARRWPFTVAEILLLLAAGAAVAAIHVHWLPCGGDAITASSISDACLTRMDTSWAFPFAPEAGERTPLADGLRLTTFLLLATAWTLFVLAQRLRPLIRVWTALPVIALLVMALDTALLIADPAADPHWWGETALYAMDLLTVTALVAVTAALLRGPSGGARCSGLPATMTYSIFRWRTSLLLLGVTSASFFRALLEFWIMIGLSDLNWDTPPGTGYLGAGFIALTALSSLVLGLLAPRPTAETASGVVALTPLRLAGNGKRATGSESR